MSRLRRALDVPGLITTVVKRGYRFNGVRVDDLRPARRPDPLRPRGGRHGGGRRPGRATLTRVTPDPRPPTRAPPRTGRVAGPREATSARCVRRRRPTRAPPVPARPRGVGLLALGAVVWPGQRPVTLRRRAGPALAGRQRLRCSSGARTWCSGWSPWCGSRRPRSNRRAGVGRVLLLLHYGIFCVVHLRRSSAVVHLASSTLPVVVLLLGADRVELVPRSCPVELAGLVRYGAELYRGDVARRGRWPAPSVGFVARHGRCPRGPFPPRSSFSTGRPSPVAVRAVVVAAAQARPPDVPGVLGPVTAQDRSSRPADHPRGLPTRRARRPETAAGGRPRDLVHDPAREPTSARGRSEARRRARGRRLSSQLRPSSGGPRGRSGGAGRTSPRGTCPRRWRRRGPRRSPRR